jgi:hypothetical protein
MASAYAALGQRSRAQQFVNDAASRLETVYQNRGGFIHGVGTFELCHALAVAHIRLGDLDSACALLTKAIEKGGRDWRWMESDPELAPVREHIGPLIEQVQRLPALRFGGGAKAA